MEPKIILNIDEFLENLKSPCVQLTEHICRFNSASECIEEYKNFFDLIETAHRNFFTNEIAGRAIKLLYDRDQTQSVMCMSFHYALDQYNEYLNGMKKYVEESRNRQLDEQEKTKVVETIEDIIMKDKDFIQGLFRFGDNKHNEERLMPLSDAMNNIVCLFKIKDIALKFREETYTDSPFDMLYMHSKVYMVYTAFVGVCKQVKRIVDQINGDVAGEEQVSDKPRYAVF